MTYTVDSTDLSTEFKKASRFYGVYARVARELGLSHEHVRQVALGNRTSKKVSKAIKREIRRVEKLSERAA